jgi:hypothetical protein
MAYHENKEAQNQTIAPSRGLKITLPTDLLGVEIQCVMSVPGNHGEAREAVLGFYDKNQAIVCETVGQLIRMYSNCLSQMT